MRLSHKQQIFTSNIAKLIIKAQELNIGLTFGDAYRTQSQVLLNYYGYDVVRDNMKLILERRNRNSNTLSSQHSKRLAVDFNFFLDGKLTYRKKDLQELGDYWESLDKNNSWGGNWKSFVDTPHFQMG